MGREIRMVPPNWEHPKIEVPNYRLGTMETRYQPMFNRPFAPAMREWIAEWDKWESGERPDYCDDENKNIPYWEWAGGPPDPEYYRPDWPEGLATWYQVYQTVSEGTPVTPPFPTKEALVEYLMIAGDFWDQERGRGGYTRAEAEAFVGVGYAPSAVIFGGKGYQGIECASVGDK